MPFFIGYTILGLTLFYNVEYFTCFQQAFVSLICLSYGNMIYELSFVLGDNVLGIFMYIIINLLSYDFCFDLQRNLFDHVPEYFDDYIRGYGLQ